MIWQKYAVATSLSLVLIGLSGCAGQPKQYRDTSELEKPPELEVVSITAESSTNDASKAAENDNTGLGDVVKLNGDGHLQLILSLDEAWKRVKKSIEISEMEISDRNREKGQYYVVFDPDNAELKSADSLNFLSTFFKDDNYPTARYLLTLSENAQGVDIKAEFLELTESSEVSPDGYAQHTNTDNGVGILLKKLYSALHDDLPLK